MYSNPCSLCNGNRDQFATQGSTKARVSDARLQVPCPKSNTYPVLRGPCTLGSEPLQFLAVRCAMRARHEALRREIARRGKRESTAPTYGWEQEVTRFKRPPSATVMSENKIVEVSMTNRFRALNSELPEAFRSINTVQLSSKSGDSIT